MTGYVRSARHDAVSKPGGTVFAAAISRYALPGDGIRNGWIDGEKKERSVEHVIAHGVTPAIDEEWFLSMSYCHRADELRDEVSSAGLSVEALYGIEGPLTLSRCKQETPMGQTAYWNPIHGVVPCMARGCGVVEHRLPRMVQRRRAPCL